MEEMLIKFVGIPMRVSSAYHRGPKIYLLLVHQSVSGHRESWWLFKV